jgi:hypothetical protein
MFFQLRCELPGTARPSELITGPSPEPGGIASPEPIPPAPHGLRTRTISRLLCGLWLSFLLFMWPSSDWIGLLILSQALLAAAWLLKSSRTGSNGDSVANARPTEEFGEDYEH